MGAARVASPQTLPLSLFYALSQAGRAIAAARLEGEWRLQGHGLESSNLDADDLCQARVRPKATKKERPDSFNGVCRATRVNLLQSATTVGELWASLPGLEKLLPELSGRKPLHVEVSEIGTSPLEDVTKVRAKVAPLEAKSAPAVKKELAGYRCGSDIEVFEMEHIAPIDKMTAYGDGAAVGRDGDSGSPRCHLARRTGRYLHRTTLVASPGRRCGPLGPDDVVGPPARTLDAGALRTRRLGTSPRLRPFPSGRAACGVAAIRRRVDPEVRPRIALRPRPALDAGWDPGIRRNRCDDPPMLCAMTGKAHQFFWMRSAWWYQDCRQKAESCCEGGGCPSVSKCCRPRRASRRAP
jgi:hypothetical protein